MSIKRRSVTAFVDWNSQISNAKLRGELRATRQVEGTAAYVANKISTVLPLLDASADLFDVDLRIYYGWYRGLTAMPSRAALVDLIEKDSVPLVISNVRFNWRAPFGDVLMHALDRRLHPTLRIHLPNTVRDDFGTGPREKMVDSALICDLLCCARSDPADIRVVMAEDDDMVPAAFVCERWEGGKAGKTIIYRARPAGPFLSLGGLLKLI